MIELAHRLAAATTTTTTNTTRATTVSIINTLIFNYWSCVIGAIGYGGVIRTPVLLRR